MLVQFHWGEDYDRKLHSIPISHHHVAPSRKTSGNVGSDRDHDLEVIPHYELSSGRNRREYRSAPSRASVREEPSESRSTRACDLGVLCAPAAGRLGRFLGLEFD
ncbi:hypothetical protein TIFTF001_032130 [Ficus carica]|uniref:Uncharacterized protein n=1 Tax=Ficus carica TaxID=3494 RepID=A0AA88DWQ5_FICCA|nr:hypothetical protein TIFTF001_032130 [Ficus carica]